MSFLLVLVTCVAFINVSQGIELNPAKERIAETIKIGEENPGKKIFDTELVKPAVFGNWPEFGGGLIKSRLVDVAVMAAMMRKARKTLHEEDALMMMESNELAVSYRGGDDVFKIRLRQGGRLIEPVKLIRPERGGNDGDGHAVFYVASFPYSSLDLTAKTTVIIVKDFGEDRYDVDFSRIK